ncbi:hypothetical protein [Microbispora catharanthi]|nr:hypothetical protein [Microbispora catharanthi]
MTNDDHRSALIAGLRALADFLDANPAVPVLAVQEVSEGIGAFVIAGVGP